MTQKAEPVVLIEIDCTSIDSINKKTSWATNWNIILDACIKRAKDILSSLPQNEEKVYTELNSYIKDINAIYFSASQDIYRLVANDQLLISCEVSSSNTQMEDKFGVYAIDGIDEIVVYDNGLIQINSNGVHFPCLHVHELRDLAINSELKFTRGWLKYKIYVENN